MIDLHQLRIFVAVAREGNLTRASEAVFLSPPAVSSQIKALEETLGLTLFERGSRGMRLTSEGKMLLEEANTALNAANNITKKAQSLKNTVHGQCTIGTVSDPAILKLGELMSELLGRHPGLQLSFTQGISGEIIEKISQKKLDAGFIIGNTEDKHIESIVIMPITLCIVAPFAWSDRVQNADWNTLATLPWLSTPQNCSFHHISNQLFLQNGRTPKTIIEADQESTLRRLVASGIGLSLLRKDVANEAVSQDEAYIWEGEQIQTELRFVYPKNARSEARITAILGALQHIWHVTPSSSAV